MDDAEVIVARSPGIFQKLTARVFEGDGERIAQRRAPLLIPTGMTAGIAAAITPPTIDAMETAPRSLLDDLHLMRRWMPFEIFSVVGEPRELLGFDGVQSVGERHVAEAMMMAVAFAIGGDMDELWPPTVLVESADEPIDQVFAARQQAFESDAAGNGAVVEKQRDGPAGGQTLLIGLRWIYLSAAYIAPGASGDAANASRLV